MSDTASNLLRLNAIKADLFAATGEKELDTTGKTLETLHELWSGISGGTLQAKSVVPSSVDVEVTPDAGYNALSAVNIAAAPNLKPWNIRKGKTLFGITGTAEIAVSTDVPPDIPAKKDDADAAYEENVGEAPTDSDGNELDMMVLADDDGNITYGYFADGDGAANGNGTALYNGVELPALPEWDKETYPYAYIDKLFNYHLVLSSAHLYVDNTESNTLIGSLHSDGAEVNFMIWSCATGGSSWNLANEGAGVIDRANTVVWANTNLYYLNSVNDIDGTVYLAASDPIPLNYNTIIRWDGNTEGRLEVTDGAFYFYKVSDLVPSIEYFTHCLIAYSDGSWDINVDSRYILEYDFGFSLGLAVVVVTNPDADTHGAFTQTGIYFASGDAYYVSLLAYNSTTYPSGFTITTYDPITTNFAAVGWRRLSYHTTGELAGTWTYDDFSTTASFGGNFLKNIIQCSREKLYYNGVEVWPNNRYGGEST